MANKVNVSTLLRDFPQVSRAVLAGGEVFVKTRDGDLRIIADRPEVNVLLGRCKAMQIQSDDSIDKPTTSLKEWGRHFDGPAR